MKTNIENPELLLKNLSTRLTTIEGKIKKHVLENNLFHSCSDKKIDIKPIVYEGLPLINVESFYILHRSHMPQILYTPYEKKIKFYKSDEKNLYTHFVDESHTNYELKEDTISDILKNYQGNELEINKHIVVNITVTEESYKCPIAGGSLCRFTNWLRKNNYTFTVAEYEFSYCTLNDTRVFEIYIPIRIIRLFNAF